MAGWPQIPIDTERGYNLCFGCGKDNPIGLKLDFKREGKTVRTEFTPTEFYQGWSDIVHGGIIIRLLDEAMGYATRFAGMNCITASMKARLRCPTSIGEPLIITSSVTENKRRLVKTEANIFLKDGTAIAEATATHFVLDPKPRKISPEKETRSNA